MIPLILTKPWDLLIAKRVTHGSSCNPQKPSRWAPAAESALRSCGGLMQEKRQTGLRFCKQLSLKLTSQRNTRKMRRKPGTDEATDISQLGHIICTVWSDARHRQKPLSLMPFRATVQLLNLQFHWFVSKDAQPPHPRWRFWAKATLFLNSPLYIWHHFRVMFNKHNVNTNMLEGPTSLILWLCGSQNDWNCSASL